MGNMNFGLQFLSKMPVNRAGDKTVGKEAIAMLTDFWPVSDEDVGD